MVNAWCMPGGKIAVYTGLLKVTKKTDALSIVMGHEVAHAVARHSLERASQAMTINLGTSVADIFLGGAINRTRNTIIFDRWVVQCQDDPSINEVMQMFKNNGLTFYSSHPKLELETYSVKNSKDFE